MPNRALGSHTPRVCRIPRWRRFVLHTLVLLAALSAWGAPDGRGLSRSTGGFSLSSNGRTCVRASALSLISPAGRVNEPVPNLYESIDPSRPWLPDEWRSEDIITSQGSTTRIETKIYLKEAHPDYAYPPEASVKRSLDRSGRNLTLIFNSARLDTPFVSKSMETRKIPAWVQVPGVPALVPGKGIPTITYVTLRQMRLLKIPYGGLTSAYVESVSNATALLQIGAHLKNWRLANPGKSSVPTQVMSQAIKNTHTYRYLETGLIQSGHRVRDVNQAGVRPFQWIDLNWITDLRRPSSQTLEEYSRSIQSGGSKETLSLGAALGLDPEDLVPKGLALEFKLEPWR